MCDIVGLKQQSQRNPSLFSRFFFSGENYNLATITRKISEANSKLSETAGKV